MNTNNVNKRIISINTRPRSCLAGAFLAFVSVAGLHGQTPKPAPVDPATHAAHIAAGKMPTATAPDATKGDPALSQQVSQLREKVAQLEAALAKSASSMAAAPAGAAMPGMSGAATSTTPIMSMGMDNMKSGGGMPGMSAGATPAPSMAGMSGTAAPTGGMMGMAA